MFCDASPLHPERFKQTLKRQSGVAQHSVERRVAAIVRIIHPHRVAPDATDCSLLPVGNEC